MNSFLVPALEQNHETTSDERKKMEVACFLRVSALCRGNAPGNSGGLAVGPGRGSVSSITFHIMFPGVRSTGVLKTVPRYSKRKK